MSSEGRADQFACTERLLAATPDAAVVSNLGVASYVLAAVSDRDRNCYLWGSMGATTPVGLGVALTTDEQVTVLDGDGSTLMSLGALATVADLDPPNLTVVVWDNASYATTGGQETLSPAVDLAGVARACGLDVHHAASDDGFEAAYADAAAADRASVVVCEVEPVDPDARPPLEYAAIARRFRRALTGE